MVSKYNRNIISGSREPHAVCAALERVVGRRSLPGRGLNVRELGADVFPAEAAVEANVWRTGEASSTRERSRVGWGPRPGQTRGQRLRNWL